jgi:hypothetical protein
MLCEIGGEVRRNSLKFMKLVTTELLGDHNELTREPIHYWTEPC